MPNRLPSLLALVVVSGLFGCADLAHEPLKASRDDSRNETAKVTEAPAAPATDAVDPISFGFVVDVEGQPLVVLRGEPDESWSAGEAALVSKGDLYVARREVALDVLPASVERQLGQKLALFDEHGLRCEAVTTGLALIVRADPRADTRDEWAGKGYSGSTKKATPAEIATDVWSMNAPQLMASVRAVKGTCTGATFARAALLPAPTVTTAIAADPTTAARVFSFARTTPGFVAIQTQFATETKIAGEPPRPADWNDMPSTTTEIVTMRAGASTYAWISIATEAGCGEFNARYGALLREDPTAKGGFVIVHAPDGGVTEQPRALIDVGDGAPTMMFEHAALRPDAGDYRFESQTVWSMECPC